MFGIFSGFLFLYFLGGCLSARTKLFWSLLAIFLFILIHQGVLLGRSFASMLSLLCLLVPVRISWSASARESFPNRHKTSPKWTPSMTLKLPVAEFGGPSVVHAMIIPGSFLSHGGPIGDKRIGCNPMDYLGVPGQGEGRGGGDDACSYLDLPRPTSPNSPSLSYCAAWPPNKLCIYRF